eukprot:4784667-Prymnesium_polylepis.2
MTNFCNNHTHGPSVTGARRRGAVSGVFAARFRTHVRHGSTGPTAGPTPPAACPAVGTQRPSRPLHNFTTAPQWTMPQGRRSTNRYRLS